MIFSNITHVEEFESSIRVTGPKDAKFDLEASLQHVSLTSTRLTIRSNLNWEWKWRTNEPEDNRHGVPSTTVSAILKPVKDAFYAFNKEQFLGPVAKITAHFQVGEIDEIIGTVWEADGEIDEGVAFHMTCVLSESSFKELFHPIWVRQAKSAINMTIATLGYQWGPEAAFGRINNQENIVLKVGRSVTFLRTISLVTDIQN